ncbi:MAG: neutral zinc metallopeptidase, partial [Acidimicrobiia bacterium]|nr:neutral zinc metallopeptidase [Acidimicrobiia bacterium]
YAANGETYQYTELVIFEGLTNSGCGGADERVGPHYCPLDQTVYIDLDFFRQLAGQFGAPGDFAQAYVLAHEIGHHIQTIEGINEQVRQAQQNNPAQANELSVAMELQADCLAGVWAYDAENTTNDLGQVQLEIGDLQEGLGAAAAVGDDRIQQASTGRVDPESWTHGSAAQRQEWFMRGYQSGDPNQCNTFG